MKGQWQELVDALERGRRFVSHDVWRVGRPGEEIPHGFIIKHVRVVILLMQGLVKDALLLRAAALTFTTMLAIVPLLAIMVFIMETFELEEDIYGFISQKVFQGVAQSKEARGETLNEAGQGRSDAAGAAVSQAAETSGEGGESDLYDPVRAVIDFAKRGSNPRALGLWGVVFMFATVFGLMSNIESSFNQIWGLRRTRSYYRMLTDYLIVVLILPFLAVGVLSTTAAPHMLGVSEKFHPLAVRGGQVLVAWAAFAALYYFVPNTRVKVRYAVLGGAVSGALWSLASWAYVSFQLGLQGYKLIYQTFAQVPVLLMWVYVSWVILLFGAELTFAYQNETTFAMERLAAGASHAYREAVAVRVMLEMAWRFDQGLPALEPSQAARAWNVPTRLVNDTLRDLENAGLVRQCATNPVSYQPGRSLAKITVGDVVKALRESGCDPSALREDEAFRPLFEEIQGTRNGMLASTLATLVHEGRFKPPVPLEVKGNEL